MTLKNKLAKLKGLQNEEARIKSEIANIRNRVENTSLRKYNYEELRDKYNNIDFHNITHTELSELMLNDFAVSNLEEIEKRNLYNHNMKILESILDKTPRQVISNSSNPEEALMKARQIMLDKDYNEDYIDNTSETKTINLKDDMYEDYYTSDEELDDETLKKLNNFIDESYAFNMKILKTFCIYCHYRDIYLPSQNELDEIKEALEGWKFLEYSGLKKLKKGTQIMYLRTIKGKLVLRDIDGESKFNSIIRNNKISIKENKKTLYLTKLNPIFIKIQLSDVS